MGEDLESAILEKGGIVGDRVYAFFDEKGRDGRGFPWPWITARQVPKMLLYEPRFASDDLTKLEFFSSGTRIEKDEFESLVEKEYSLKIKLKFDERGNHDSKPVSLLGLDTIAQLERESMQLQQERFRANIYAKWDDPKPFFEDELVGKELKIGSAKIRVVKKNSRCEITTFDPNTAKPSRIVLENIARNHGGCVGVYASIESIGQVRTGDEISIEKV